jgi:hypothetical protein
LFFVTKSAVLQIVSRTGGSRGSPPDTLAISPTSASDIS